MQTKTEQLINVLKPLLFQEVTIFKLKMPPNLDSSQRKAFLEGVGRRLCTFVKKKQKNGELVLKKTKKHSSNKYVAINLILRKPFTQEELDAIIDYSRAWCLGVERNIKNLTLNPDGTKGYRKSRRAEEDALRIFLVSKILEKFPVAKTRTEWE